MKLTAVEEGSTVAELTRVVDDGDSLDIEVEGLLSRAARIIDKAFIRISSGERLEGSELPEQALSILRQFGSSLQGEEYFKFASGKNNGIRYTRSSRAAYLANLREGHRIETTSLVGHITSLAGRERHFVFVIHKSGQSVDGSYTNEHLFTDLKEALQVDEEVLFRITCDCEYRPNGELARIVDVDTLDFFAALNTLLGKRLIQLAELDDGWLGDGGSQVSLDAIEFARDLVADLDEDGKPIPRIYPTASGGLQLEWHSESGDTEVVIERDLTVSAFHFGTCEESLEGARGVGSIAEFLRGCL
ncbi:MAG: hypothetical protein LBJ08_08335 [Bifidobacteriaceae bacterium]|nr:hypothetical protein [Bifidobacteriaceae bacterium]